MREGGARSEALALSSVFKYFWMPAFAGMTKFRTFYESVTQRIDSISDSPALGKSEYTCIKRLWQGRYLSKKLVKPEPL